MLSGGQRHINIIDGNFEKPKVLLLDEHTAILDPKTSDMVLKLTEEVIQRDQLTALMINMIWNKPYKWVTAC